MKQIWYIKTVLFILIITTSNLSAQLRGGRSSDSSNFSFVPVPYINYDRTLGGTFGLMPMAMYHLSKKDTLSPSSISGLGAVYTTNKSYVFALFSKFYFGHNKYRATVAAAKGNVNSQFFQDVPGYQGYVDYNNNTFYFLAQLQHRIINNVYGGLNFSYIDQNTEFADDAAPPEVSKRVGIGAIVTLDTRDSIYYPRSGYLSTTKFNSVPDFLGNEYVSNTITTDLNHYQGILGQRDVIALRAYLGIGLGDLSFSQQFVVNNVDLRGYTQGRYRGKQIAAVQGEYRYNPFKKVGFVGFAGVASVFSGDNEGDNATPLPSVGTGFRINVFPKNHMNIGMDIAVGKGDWGMYFRIGESF